MAIQGVFNNIFYGIILSIPVAAILCRNNETGAIRQEQ
jgi:tetrahydromethanopterin S-methyltransferase subunit B